MFPLRPLLLVLALAALALSTPANAGGGDDLLGTRPPEWTAAGWVHSEPLTLAGLRGRVVLARWWTAGCPLCAASAPVLEALHGTYGGRGLTVIGFYHHKAPGRPDPARVERWADSLGFTFPVAIDPAWQTLRRWWLDGARRGYTSVTFLLDREGVIRYVHPGGEIAQGSPGHAALVAAVEELLRER